MLILNRDNYSKNPDLSLFYRKSLYFLFLQNWTLTFQFSANQYPTWLKKTELPLMKPQLSPSFPLSLLPNTKCSFYRYTKNPYLSHFCRKKSHLLFLQNQTLTFQFFTNQYLMWLEKTELPLMKSQLNPDISLSLLPNTKCQFLPIFFFQIFKTLKI